MYQAGLARLRPCLCSPQRILFALWTALLLTGLIAPRVQAAAPVPVVVTSTTYAAPAAPCQDTFVPHELDHITTTEDGIIRMFEANGSGLATGDLDQDGDLDLVLGNYAGQDAIFWNETDPAQGGIAWRKQPFGDGYTRAVTVVDVDGDTRLDIVLTRSTGALNYFHNNGLDTNGDTTFTRQVLPGVSTLATALNWADLDQDGDLDLITATYDAGLLTDLGNAYLYANNGGISLYLNRLDEAAARFERIGLAATAQAQAILLHDLDGDGLLDIFVGNDFNEPDRVWEQTPDGWTETMPFSAFTHSTMSFDLGDVNNDGTPEIFAGDMKPFADDPATQTAWEPLMAAMMNAPHPPGDLQVMANTFQVQTAPGVYADQAAAWGIDGTGWSWSAKFGDLNNDGLLDLYVVNGMIEARMFAHLPNHELVEPNLAFANTGRGTFALQPDWGLGSTASGRGMVMGDFDLDGDLDIAVNNLRAPAQVFENRLCGGRSLQIDLRQNSPNRHAIGAQVRLRTNRGDFYRTVQAASGYLSGDTARLHFGLPAGTVIGRMEITWPDGAQSSVTDLLPGQILRVERR